MKGMSAEDMLVYQLVAEAGNTGIWSRDIKNKSNLQQPQVTRILKELEKRQLIKAVR